ncbi:hypothetical protein THASP1DRAFT_30024 [Thamnocephalis sphaerospora]|uniref:Uncharacterized protein n=1 Tax=Thamnocephalis sphaerospora TaxID=78915 RepID=A0A4P9XRM4_9FUNG|nr:hypothetical protein THASP1DRAFT_30024 [Thamnocephalis sphaerospora]|eukprot:RKP08161.1 hypothetical protein THASP1DRAFT_30024 [Thamnocephalis sphaerospora]
MRFTSFLGTLAAATLAGLALIGSLASALTVPPRSSTPSVLPQELLPTSDGITALKEFSELFILDPSFAVVKPEGANALIKRNRRRKVKSIRFANADSVTVGSVLVEYRTDNHMPEYMTIKRHTLDGNVSDVAVIEFEYDEDYRVVETFRLEVPRKSAIAEQYAHPNGSTTMLLNLPDMATIETHGVQLWDGRSIPIASASDV